MLKHFFRGPFVRFAYKASVKNVIGLENLPKGSFIVAANHISYMDIWALSAVFLVKARRNVIYLAKKELSRNYLISWFINNYDPIYFDRENDKQEIVETAANELKKGGIIGIFPEGARSPDGKLQKGKTGVARLALLAKVPVLPVGIKGTREMMPKGSYFPKFNKNAIINIGHPMKFNKYYKKKITKKLLRQMTDDIMKQIAELIGQKYNF